ALIPAPCSASAALSRTAWPRSSNEAVNGAKRMQFATSLFLVVGERVRSVMVCPVRNGGYRSSQIVRAVGGRAKRGGVGGGLFRGGPRRARGGVWGAAGGRGVVRDSRPVGGLEGPAPRPPLQGAHFFARCSPLKDEHLAGGMSTLQTVAWPTSIGRRHLVHGTLALRQYRDAPWHGGRWPTKVRLPWPQTVCLSWQRDLSLVPCARVPQPRHRQILFRCPEHPQPAAPRSRSSSPPRSPTQLRMPRPLPRDRRRSVVQAGRPLPAAARLFFTGRKRRRVSSASSRLPTQT